MEKEEVYSNANRGYSGYYGPYKIPLLQLQILAEIIFLNLDFEDIITDYFEDRFKNWII